MSKVSREEFEKLLKNSKKIAIIGGSGTGKTTLSNKFKKNLNLPSYHLDGIDHLPNWKKRDEKERDRMIMEIADKSEWIIDGTYRSTLKYRLERADLIIYLDYSSLAQISGVMKRAIKNHGNEKEEIPGCKERMTWSFFWFVLTWRKKKRKDVLKILDEIDKNKIIVLKSRRQLNSLKLFEE